MSNSAPSASLAFCCRSVFPCDQDSARTISLDFRRNLALRELQRNSELSSQQIGGESKVISYNSAISACERGGHWRLAFNLLEELLERSLPADSVTFNAILSVIEKGRDWKQAKTFLRRLRAFQVKLSLVAYNSAISACEKCGEWQQARLLLCELSAECQPDVISYNAAIGASERRGAWQPAQSLLREMYSMGMEPNLITFSSATSACERTGVWRQAQLLLREAEGKLVMANMIMLTSAISACAKAAAARQAYSLLHSKAASPNVLSYYFAVSALETTSDHLETISCLEAADHLGISELAKLSRKNRFDLLSSLLVQSLHSLWVTHVSFCVFVLLF